MLLPCTLRPRRGRRAAAVAQKTIKKLIPRCAGLLFLILFSVKLERERKNSVRWTSSLVAILPRTRRQSDLVFTTASSVGSYKGVREDHPAEGRFEESTTATRSGERQEAGSTPLGRVEVAFGGARLAPFCSSSPNQVIAAIVNGSPEEAEKIRFAYILSMFELV